MSSKNTLIAGIVASILVLSGLGVYTFVSLIADSTEFHSILGAKDSRQGKPDQAPSRSADRENDENRPEDGESRPEPERSSASSSQNSNSPNTPQKPPTPNQPRQNPETVPEIEPQTDPESAELELEESEEDGLRRDGQELSLDRAEIERLVERGKSKREEVKHLIQENIDNTITIKNERAIEACENVANNMAGSIQNFIQAEENRTRAYSNILTNTYALLENLRSEGYEVAEFELTLNNLSSEIESYDTELALLYEQIGNSYIDSCGAEESVFRQSIQNLRQQYSDYRSEAQNLKNNFSTTLISELSELREQIDSQIDASSQTDDDLIEAPEAEEETTESAVQSELIN